MKKLLLLLSVCLGICTFVKGQAYFNVLNNGWSDGGYTAVIPRDSLYYCLDSYNYGTTTNATGQIRFSALNDSGNQVHFTLSSLSHISGLIAGNSLQQTPDNGFLTATWQYVDSIAIYHLMLIKYDSSGSFSWTKVYDDPFCNLLFNTFRIEDLKATGTNEWLMLCTSVCFTDSVMALIKLDSNFNIEWGRQYDTLNLHETAGKLCIVQDGYVIGGVTTDTHQAIIMKTDTAGSPQWEWMSDTSQKIYADQMGLLQTQDGGYVYCAKVYTRDAVFRSDNTYATKGWIEKIDSHRNVLWHRTVGSFDYVYGYSGLNVITEQSDGSLVVAGSIAMGDYHAYNSTDVVAGALMKLSANGDSVWFRSYVPPAWHSIVRITHIQDMKPTPDGGFILVGDFVSDGGDWAIKVDGNGCQGPNDPQCWPTGVPKVVKQDHFKLYPNPSKGIFTLSSPGLSIGGELHIYNAIGQDVYNVKISSAKQTFSIDVPAGVYVAEVMDDSGGRYVQRLVVEQR